MVVAMRSDEGFQEILLKIHEIGIETRKGAFLFQVCVRGLLSTIMMKLMLFFMTKKMRYELAVQVSKSSRDQLVQLMVEDEDRYGVAAVQVFANYVFILGENDLSKHLAVKDLQQLFRKAIWNRGLKKEASPALKQLVEAYKRNND